TATGSSPPTAPTRAAASSSATACRWSASTRWSASPTATRWCRRSRARRATAASASCCCTRPKPPPSRSSDRGAGRLVAAPALRDTPSMSSVPIAGEARVWAGDPPEPFAAPEYYRGVLWRRVFAYCLDIVLIVLIAGLLWFPFAGLTVLSLGLLHPIW